MFGSSSASKIEGFWRDICQVFERALVCATRPGIQIEAGFHHLMKRGFLNILQTTLYGRCTRAPIQYALSSSAGPVANTVRIN